MVVEVSPSGSGSQLWLRSFLFSVGEGQKSIASNPAFLGNRAVTGRIRLKIGVSAGHRIYSYSLHQQSASETDLLLRNVGVVCYFWNILYYICICNFVGNLK